MNLYKKGVWERVEMSDRKNLVTGKWDFAPKRNSKEVVKHKARNVDRGFKQKRVEYDQKYSPTVKMGKLRVLLSFGSSKRNEVETVRHKSAYLNAGVEENFFGDQPPGFVTKNGNCKNHV